jgi:hypothetical protein
LLDRLEKVVAALEHFLLGVHPDPPARPNLRVLRGDSALEERPVHNTRL